MKICVLGAGCWGATLATLLSKNGYNVNLWEFYLHQAEVLRDTRKLKVLPQLSIPENIFITPDISTAVKDTDVIVVATPSHFVRSTVKLIKNNIKEDAIIVSVSKGLEEKTLKRITEIIKEEISAKKINLAVLSGPSHAEEVCVEIPTAVVCASDNQSIAEKVQQIFSNNYFRVFISNDIIGVELGGALKNIIAIAAGIADGLGKKYSNVGDNSKAAVVSRGLYEITVIGTKLGGKPETFFGLSGLGDLIVTCYSKHSRNRLLGEKIGEGKNLTQALSEMTMVAEGVKTTLSVHEICEKFQLKLGIIDEVYLCLYENKPANESLSNLLKLKLSIEMKDLSFYE